MIYLDDRPTVWNKKPLHHQIMVNHSTRNTDSNRFKRRFERGQGFGERLHALIRRFSTNTSKPILVTIGTLGMAHSLHVMLLEDFLDSHMGQNTDPIRIQTRTNIRKMNSNFINNTTKKFTATLHNSILLLTLQSI